MHIPTMSRCCTPPATYARPAAWTGLLDVKNGAQQDRTRVTWGCEPDDVSMLHAARYVRAAGGLDRAARRQKWCPAGPCPHTDQIPRGGPQRRQRARLQQQCPAGVDGPRPGCPVVRAALARTPTRSPAAAPNVASVPGSSSSAPPGSMGLVRVEAPPAPPAPPAPNNTAFPPVPPAPPIPPVLVAHHRPRRWCSLRLRRLRRLRRRRTTRRSRRYRRPRRSRRCWWRLNACLWHIKRTFIPGLRVGWRWES